MRHLLASLALAAGGCGSIAEIDVPARAGCAVGEPMVETMLFLGMNRPGGGTVSEADFAHFIEQEVTPRWREGYTVLEGAGLWYSEQRKATDREATRVLLRLHDGSAAASSVIEAIRTAYVGRFSQDAVLRIDHPTCADFSPGKS
jgi:hypothetical protein